MAKPSPSRNETGSGIIQAGKDLRRSQANFLLPAGSAMRPDQIAQDFIQLSLENFWGCRLQRPSGQPAPAFNCPHREKAFPCIQSDFFFQLKATLPIVKLV